MSRTPGFRSFIKQTLGQPVDQDYFLRDLIDSVKDTSNRYIISSEYREPIVDKIKTYSRKLEKELEQNNKNYEKEALQFKIQDIISNSEKKVVLMLFLNTFILEDDKITFINKNNEPRVINKTNNYLPYTEMLINIEYYFCESQRYEKYGGWKGFLCKGFSGGSKKRTANKKRKTNKQGKRFKRTIKK